MSFTSSRLTSILKSDRTAISEETITQFLLPLTTCYLFDKAYDSQNHLVDASFECLQAMSRCLSWYNYDKLLRYFLTQMTRQIEFQKQSVKALVAVLNGFHFDLKNSQFKGNNKPQIETVTDDVVLVEVPKESDAAEVDDELLDLEVKEEEKTDQSVEAATRIHSIIAQQLLPQLNKILTARSKRDAQHKSVKDHFPEDDEILRVPIALALVHLLKNLPSGALERNLPG
jgi:U3 small nucleolar RNA-associated protein 20